MSSPFEKPNPFQSSTSRVFCPGCGTALTATAVPGQWVQCPKCGHQTVLLQLDEGAPGRHAVVTSGTPATADEENPFAEVRTPSAWQTIKERTKQERQQRRQALVAVALEFAGVALAASLAASIGMEDGAFFSALNLATLGGLCGGGFCVGIAMVGATGGHRVLLPAYYAAALPPTPAKGVPMLFPLALAMAIGGIFLFTTLGAAVGAEIPGREHHSTAAPLRAFLGGAVGMVPVGLWWVLVRKRAGKRNLAVIVVLASFLSLTCIATVTGLLSGSLQPTRLDYDAWCKRAADREKIQDWDGAIAAYTKAIKLNPTARDAFLLRGNARDDKGDFDGAIADYTQAITLSPTWELAFYNRAHSRDKKGDLKGAIADYTRAIEINSEWDGPYQNRGYARFKQGDMDGAIADCSKAIELNGKDAGAFWTRGLAVLEKGRDAEAQKDFDQCLKLNPSSKAELDRDIQETKRRRQQKR
jgi:Tfp pilus assembly protein PilF